MRSSAPFFGIARIKTAFDLASLSVVTATPLEYRVACAELPGVNVVNAGIGLSNLGQSLAGTAISCGLAGGLTDRLTTGTVVIPDVIGRADGTALQCDPELTQRLRASADSLGVPYSSEALVTTSAIARGEERQRWAQRGFVAADMESALLQAPRVAAVRVILDLPSRELHAAWVRPASVIFHPRAWLELPWLAREAPRCARLAARVIAKALNQSRDCRGSSD
ncbi:MAG: hypothetical protein JOZ97_00070 [Candidatus Eremiobacteraeota bacterium]|nr:hypothetical protein [Candidatus Eremiobacteraeota bacterium]